MNRRSFVGMLAGLLASAGVRQPSLPIVNAAGHCPDVRFSKTTTEIGIRYRTISFSLEFHGRRPPRAC